MPLGMLSLWAGGAKLGKSYVSLAVWPLCVSQAPGRPHSPVPGGGPAWHSDVGEDDPARTTIVRLDGAGADLSRVHVLESIRSWQTDQLPSLRDDAAHLEAAARDRLGDCRLIVIDPISAILGGKDAHHNAEVRRILSPLKAMASGWDSPVVLVTT